MAENSHIRDRQQLTNPGKEAAAFGLSRTQGWALLFLIYAGIFVSELGYHYLEDLARVRGGTFRTRFLEERR